MARLMFGHVKVNDCKIHYFRTGEEKPPVVLLHGFTDNAFSWSRLALKLEPFFDLVMIDLRGHGLSDAPEDGYTQFERATDIAAVISELKLYKPVLIGHSYGAETAVLVAKHYPKFIGSLVLEDPPFWKDGVREAGRPMSEITAEVRNKIETLRNKSLDELIELSEKKHPLWHEKDHFQWGKAKQQVRTQITNAMELDEPNWQEYCKKIKCPILLVLGEVEQGAIITPETAAEVKKIWRKKVEILKIPNAGHSIHRDQMEVFNETIKSFLRKQTGW